jgi:hypothetical protein
MSESFLERLSRFTPDAGSLDRDAMLFAAGRASARPNRGWIALASVLASTQALSLALLWPTSAPPTLGLPTAGVTAPRTPVERTTAESLASPGVWSAASSLKELEAEERTAETVTFVDSGPPLRAFAPPPASILN